MLAVLTVAAEGETRVSKGAKAYLKAPVALPRSRVEFFFDIEVDPRRQLRMRPEPSHHHVVLHALTQRADRGVGRDGIHDRPLFEEGAPWSDGDLSPPKAYEYHAIARPDTPPAERVRASGG